MQAKTKQRREKRGKPCRPKGKIDPAAPETDGKPSLGDNHRVGLDAFQRGDFQHASDLFWRDIQEQATAERWNDWASAQLALGLVGPAEEGYRRALDSDPQFQEAATNLTLLLAAAGRPEDAAAFLKLFPANLDEAARMRMAQALADCCRGALSCPPAHPQADPPLFAHDRISKREIEDAIQVARSKFPLHRIIVLHDGVIASGDPQIDCRRAALDKFSELDFFHSVFVYACSWHFHGAPFIQRIISKGGCFIPVWNNGPARYVDQNPVARRVLEAEWIAQRREGFDKWDCGPGDFMNLCQALEITRRVKGAFLEIGCFRGSSGSVALHYMKEAGIYREAYFFDVFDGFKYDAALSSADAVWKGSHATEGLPAIAERLKRHEQAELGLKVIVRRHNIVEEDLPDDLPPLAVACVDVDMYEAVLAALTKVAPRMAPGGILVVEDPGHTPQLVGARVALDQFMATKAASYFSPLYMESGHTFLLRDKSL